MAVGEIGVAIDAVDAIQGLLGGLGRAVGVLHGGERR